MAGIDRAFIDQVLSSTDIVELIKESLYDVKNVKVDTFNDFASIIWSRHEESKRG